jgi:hypothetical protein
MKQRSKKWEPWDKLNKNIRKIQDEYSHRAIIAAYKIFGEKMYNDPATRKAVIMSLQTDLAISLAPSK